MTWENGFHNEISSMQTHNAKILPYYTYSMLSRPVYGLGLSTRPVAFVAVSQCQGVLVWKLCSKREEKQAKRY
jgi:hypothetical protein